MAPSPSKPSHIVVGQKVFSDKVVRAKQLRRESTPGERTLWQALRSNRLGGFHFRRQQILVGYLVDFYCHAARLILEVDGGVHDLPDQKNDDLERGRHLAAQGFLILRISEEDAVQRTEIVLQRIEATLRERMETLKQS